MVLVQVQAQSQKQKLQVLQLGLLMQVCLMVAVGEDCWPW